MAESDWFGEHQQRSVIKAGVWAAVANLTTAALSLAGTVALSRLLSPAEVGLYTLAFSFYALPSLIVGPGLTTAAVQAPHLTQQQSSNLFWINVGVNAALAIVLVVASPMLAAWFNQPDLRVLCPVFAIVLVLEGFATQYRALLFRSLRFDLVARIALLVGSCGVLVGVALAWCGFGVWAMVAQAVVGALVDRGALAATVRWRPSWFDSRAPIRDLLRFSRGSGLALGMHIVYAQSPSLLMGRFASIDNVAYYSRGQALFQKPFSQILGPLHSVLLPAFSALQRDPESLGAAVYRANALLYTLLPPFAVWMMFNGSDVAVALLGEAWAPAGLPLFWFAVAAFPGILFGVLYKSYEASGRPTWGLGVRAMFLPVLLAGLVWAAPRGAAAMAAVGAGVEWLSAPVVIWLLLKECPVPRRFFLSAILECLVAAILTSVAMWYLTWTLGDLELAVTQRAAVALAASYAIAVAIAALFPFGRAGLRECLSLLRRGFRRCGLTTA